MKKFFINWRGPFTWEEVIKEEGFSDDEDIYAITWEPPKRKNRTRYIGIAIRQYIGKRLNQGHDVLIVNKIKEFASTSYYLLFPLFLGY